MHVEGGSCTSVSQQTGACIPMTWTIRGIEKQKRYFGVFAESTWSFPHVQPFHGMRRCESPKISSSMASCPRAFPGSSIHGLWSEAEVTRKGSGSFIVVGNRIAQGQI